jgi:hypothetical protein
LIVAIVRNHSCSIRFLGIEIELKKRRTKRSGKVPWTASPEPVRIAMNIPIPPNPIEIRIESAKRTGTPSGPAANPAPAIRPTLR